MLRTAREAFLRSPAKAPFQQIAESIAFDTACEYALLAYLETIPRTNDPNTGWTHAANVQGAKDVLTILRTIHLEQEPPKENRLPRLKPPA
jgi:hypothetical protein